MSTTTSPSYGQPALIGGVVMGVLSALPLVSIGNACCCMWIVSGGAIAAYLFQQNHDTPMTPSDGALVGLLAGLTGALVQFALSIPIGILVAPMERGLLRGVLDNADAMSPDVRRGILRYMQTNSELGILARIAQGVIWLMFMLFVGSVFSTIGGLLGALLFKKSAPPNTFGVAPQN